MDNEIAQYGIVGLVAITIIKLFLPYIHPAKTGITSKELDETMRPIQERQIALLEKLNERHIETHSKVCSSHETIKTIGMDVHDARITMNSLHKRFDVNFDKR